MADSAVVPLEQRILAFVRDARSAGFQCGLAETVDVTHLLAFSNPFEPMAFYWQLRSLLCSDREQWLRFESYYVAWFYPQDSEHGECTAETESFTARAAGKGSGMRYLSELQTEEKISAQADEAKGGGSAQESLSMADFRFVFDRDDQRELTLWLDQLARRIRRRLIRRHRLSTRAKALDYRRTTRRALPMGGEVMRLCFKQKRKRLPRLVLLLDVSQSMDVYTKFFMRFAMGVSAVFQESDVYAFHTRLIHLGDVLQEQHVGRLEARLTSLSKGWLGGTRIAGSLAEFNRQYAPGAVHSRTIVMVFSDGFDTAARDELKKQMALISGRAKKVLWLHPLLARPGGPKLDPGLKSAMPYIDALLPAHNLQALADLEQHLSL